MGQTNQESELKPNLWKQFPGQPDPNWTGLRVWVNFDPWVLRVLIGNFTCVINALHTENTNSTWQVPVPYTHDVTANIYIDTSPCNASNPIYTYNVREKSRHFERLNGCTSYGYKF